MRWCTEQVAGCTYLSGLGRAHRQDGLRRKFIVEFMHQASKAGVAISIKSVHKTTKQGVGLMQAGYPL